MDESCVEEIIRDRDKHPNVSIVGIHYFTGTQKKKFSKIESELKLLEELFAKLKSEYDFEPELLEYGPGLGVPYFVGDDFGGYYSVYEEMVQYIASAKYSYRVNLEMGRFFVASCGDYVTSIADVKGTPERPILILDGGRNHISYYGQNMVMKTPVIVPEKDDESIAVPCDLYGSLCSFNDMIAREVMIPDPKIGDRLVFKNIGAYSVTEGIYLFLSRDLPAVYVKREDGSCIMIRNSDSTYEVNC
jgi:diaminopimelate decarboxylase